jgi:Transcriptional regulators, similar to M. xanthus CarD
MELSIGDMVVVPSLGVGVVEERGALSLGDDEVPAWRIDLGSDGGTYWLPEHRVGKEGLRAPVDEERVERLWTALTSEKAPQKRDHWNRRRRRYDEMLATNEPLQLAKLVGELLAVQRKKRENRQVLSFSERRLLEKVRQMFTAEVSATTGQSEEEVAAELERRTAEDDA